MTALRGVGPGNECDAGSSRRVGLALDDAPSDAVDQQLAADQVVRDLEARARAPAGDVGHAGAASTRERTRRLPAI